MKYLLTSTSIFIIFSIGMIVYGLSLRSDKDIVRLKHGRISKVEFEHHSYLVWQQNWSDCIVHDQNCKCLKKSSKDD